ncbi:hypothetical protein [Clostridium sp. Ade.TY]|uniref:hypothetical protein n=1 Tax=Clostridium sp. Ade.TY TaxID=1391647 RepID=UPI000410A217|nr:hypothetical protein [Clostridium sp. Ade.TY]
MANNKKKVCAGSIVLYVIAVLVVFYMIWTLVNCHEYIQTMIAQGGLTFSGNEFNVINYYMANCAQYGFFAIVLFVLGIMLQKLSNMQLNLTKSRLNDDVIVEEVVSVEDSEVK